MKKWSNALFILPTVVLFLLFFLWPVGVLAVKSFVGESGFTLANYIAIIANGR